MESSKNLNKFDIVRLGLKLDDAIIDKINKETGSFENDNLDVIEDKLNSAIRQCRLSNRKELLDFIELTIEDITIKIKQIKIEIENSKSKADNEVRLYLNNRLKKKKKFLKKWLMKNSLIRKDHVENTYNTRVFQSKESQHFFEELIKTMGKKDAVISFIFRKLIEDSFMFDIGINEFKRFLTDDYEITVDKIKTLEIVNTKERTALYNTLIKLFHSK